MSGLRFQHVFLALMSAAFLCAFVLPPGLTDSARLGAEGLFNPLSYPIRRVALSLDEHLEQPRKSDVIDAQSLADENDQLRQEVARLAAGVENLQRLEGERQTLGDLKSLCVRVPVAGADAGGRDALFLSMPRTAGAVRENPVLYSGGLAGRLEASRWNTGSASGARVRLITDEGFAVTGAFIRFTNVNGVITPARLASPAPLVQGLGGGKLGVVGMTWADCVRARIAKGDWVILDDSLWPRAVQGVRLGRVVSVAPLASSALFADIRLSPDADLTRLADVWVMAGI